MNNTIVNNNMESQKQDQSKDAKPQVQKIYNLSPMQEGMLFHTILENESSSYFQQLCFTVEGEFDTELFEKSLNLIISRHDILRTNFVHQKVKKPQQVVFKEKQVNMNFIDLSQVEEDKKSGLIDSYLKDERRQGFDLLRGMLIQLTIFKLNDKKFRVIISNHHIILDGWSIGNITREVFQSYIMMHKNMPVKLDEPQPFITYINWLKKYDAEEALKYWEEYLFGYEQQSGVPRLSKSTDEHSYDHQEVYYYLDKNLTSGLERFAKENQITLNTAMQVIWGVLLQKYNNTDEAVFGSIVAGRPPEIKGVENMVGLFINTIPTRIKRDKEQTFAALAKQVQQQSFKTKRYEYSSLAEIQNMTELKQGLLDNIMVFENYPIEEAFMNSGDEQKFNINDVYLYMQSNYDLNICITPGQELAITFRYNALAYEKEFINKILAHITNIIKQIIITPDIRVEDIEIITEQEKLQILQDFNDTKTSYPKDKTLQELFEKQVEETPDNIAVVYEKQALTYRELNNKANQLARVLREKGLSTNTLIAIIFNRSAEMILSILAVLKAGCAYLPIDPDYPEDRTIGILQDSGTPLILTHCNDLAESYLSELSNIETILFSDIEEQMASKSTVNLELVNSSDDLAYVMYTSGSTGKPKGNLITHYNISRVVKNTNYIDISNEDILLQLSTYAFDGSTFDIYGALLNGAKLVMVNKNVLLDVGSLSQLIQSEKITMFFVTTALFNALVDVNVECFKTIKKVLFGGERVSVKHVTKAFEYMGKGRILHMYGPTESTVYATCYKVDSIDSKLGTIPIGGALSNTKIYIMNKNNGLQPIGIPGELCIGGDGLAKGYLNRPELTAEKFVANPFEEGELLYKTGDLARWLPDGTIEFLDRIDTQVKLRGFRIELGEIEAKLLTHENINEAVVLCRESEEGNKFLQAYLVADTELSVAELRSYLAQELPDYMIPSYFSQIDVMPLTANGKVDKKSLSVFESMESGVEYEAPRNEIEQALAAAWEDILGAKGIGINDNYFSQGGDSIKAIQIASRLQKDNLKMEIRDLFQHPTIGELSAYIKTLGNKAEQTVISGEMHMTPIQKWYFEQNFTNMHHFNHSVMLHSSNGFNEKHIQKVFAKLVEHHDALRIVYTADENRIMQYNRGLEGELYEFKVIDLRLEAECASKLEEEADKVQSSICLEKGPLLKVRQFKTANGDHLLIVIHHLVVDGVSWRIILEDIATGYTQAVKGQDIVFQDKTTSFKEWTEKLTAYGLSKKAKKNLKYWEAIAAKELSVLPKDSIITQNRVKDGEDITLELCEEATAKLLKDVNKAYNTEINDILISALGRTIKDWCGHEHLLINMEGHGREDIISDVNINRTVGWFTSAYPVLLNMENCSDVSYSIRSVKDQLNRVPQNGAEYGILRYLSSDETKAAIALKQKPEISFNYLGQFDQDIKGELFSISQYSTGKPVSPDMERIYTFDINGLVKDNRLSLTINYNKNEYNKETIESLAQSFKDNILKNVEHCTQRENAEHTKHTPTDFIYNKLSIEELEEINKEMGNAEIQNIYPLTPMQEGMLFNSLVSKGSHAYFEQISFDIHHEMDVVQLEKSLNTIIERHEILRVIYNHEKADRPIQIILKERLAKVYFEDITAVEEAQKSEYMEAYKNKQKDIGFDITKDLLIKLAVFKINARSYKLIFSFHHILMDGWCIGIIINEFFSLYKSFEEAKAIKLDKAYPYSGYIEWLERQDADEARAYWQKYLDEYEHQAVVPRPSSIVKNDKYEQKELLIKLDEALTKGISSIAEKNNVTFNTTFQAMWGVLLKRYNSTDDVVFGAVVSGRPHEVPGVDKIVGLFINTIPVRVKFEKGKPFSSLIKDLQLTSLESEKYDYYPLAKIQSDTELKQGLLDHIMVFENYPLENEISGSRLFGYEIDNVDVFEQTNYDFNIIVMPGKELIVKLSYNSMVYDSEFIRNIEGHLKEIIKALIESSDICADDIDIVTSKEKEHILFDFNNTAAEYPSNKTLHQLFEEQAEKTPDNIALLFGDKTLTYKELNDRANKLARVLRKQGVKPDNTVGLMVERSFEMMIGILGILKSGGAYLPIDPENPVDRIKFILSDSNTHILLTQSAIYYTHFKEENDIKVLSIDDESLYSGDGSNLENVSTPRNLSYVIYTSGSTGNPKGVLIEHRSVINILTDLQNKYPLTEKDTYLLKTTYTFDVSVAEIFGWFHSNGRLAILEPEGEKYPDIILKAIQKYNVTHINFVPSMFNVLLNTIDEKDIEILGKLKYVMVAGEAVQSETVKKFSSMAQGVNLENIYGPTESTIYCVGGTLNGYKGDDIIHIGKPLQNIKAYIVSDNRLQPVGVPGELCIAGAGLARGYLNRPELTEEKFAVNPFVEASEDGSVEKMYHTGDLARWRPDGNIEYLGRIDHQVKVRGYRIELGEIESLLLNQPEVKQALVMVRDDQGGSKYICAYIVCDKAMDVHALREALAQKLPDYMIPSFFVQLDSMPLTTSGKIDRKVLPEPDKGTNSNHDYAAPANETEEKLAAVWKEVLGLEQVGVKDAFLELGGDSIKAIQVSARLKKHNLKLAIKDIFKYSTIEEIAKRIVFASDIAIEQGAVTGEVNLTPMQTWFFENDFTNMNHWNQAVMLYGKNGFDADILEIVFNKIVEHHDALRMVYKVDQNKFIQYNRNVGEGEAFTLKVFDFTQDDNYAEKIKLEANKLQADINLENGPLVKLALFKTAQGDHLLIAVHHLVIDGVSWRIIFEDLAMGYSQVLNNEPVKFQDKTHSFKAWTSKLNEYAASKEIQAELGYWDSIEAANAALLPTDKIETEESKIKDTETIELTLTAEQTELLVREVNKAYNTEINDILLTALGMAVKKWSNNEKILVNVEGHGREDIINGIDISRTVGWFTAQYPVLLDMSKTDDISYLIRFLKEDFRKIPNKGIGYGILRYLTAKENKNISYKLNPEICFNYLGQLGQDVNTGLFGLSDISVGHMVSPESESRYKLNINGVITGDKLTIVFSYNTSQYNKDTVLELTESYKNSILNILEHCISQFESNKEAQLTPSDLGDSDLSIEDLEYMSDFLETL